MNDQAQLTNQYQVIHHLQSSKINPSQQLMNQSQALNRFQMLNSEIVSQPAMFSQMNPPQMMNMMVSQAQMAAQLNQSKMMPQSYGNWAQQPLNMPPMNNLQFPNQMNNKYGGAKPGRSNWKGKKVVDNRRRKDMAIPAGGGSVGYKPPSLNELEHQNRLKAGRFYHKKRFNRMGPYAHAPRNTTSYLIRAKKEGGIASLVSPCPVTPAVLPTPVFSPSREALVDMAKEEWGVDGYGSMKGLIRLRSSPGHEAEMDDYEEEDDGDSSESDVEEHLEVERRLDHDLSRFEMVYPDSANALGSRVDDQDTHILQLEEENLWLKERLYLMERELGEIKRRMQCLERKKNEVVEEIHDEVTENVSENESEGTTREEEKQNEVDYVIECEGVDNEREHEHGSTTKNHQGTHLDAENEKQNKICDNDLISGRGEELAENDKIGSGVVGEDLCMKDNEPESAPSEQ